MATVSINNYNQNAPQWWKRLETACIMFFVPSFTAMIVALPIGDSKKIWWEAGAAFFAGLLKGVGILLGDQPTQKDEDGNS